MSTPNCICERKNIGIRDAPEIVITILSLSGGCFGVLSVDIRHPWWIEPRTVKTPFRVQLPPSTPSFFQMTFSHILTPPFNTPGKLRILPSSSWEGLIVRRSSGAICRWCLVWLFPSGSSSIPCMQRFLIRTSQFVVIRGPRSMGPSYRFPGRRLSLRSVRWLSWL